MRACVRACVRACARARRYMFLCVYTLVYLWYVFEMYVLTVYHYCVLYNSVTEQIKDMEKKTMVITALEVHPK